MEKKQMLVLVMGILGILGVALPATVMIQSNHVDSIFLFGMIFEGSPPPEVFFLLADDAIFIVLLAGAATSIVGIVFWFLTMGPSPKMKLVKWLPGLLMLLGPVIYVSFWLALEPEVITQGMPLGLLVGIVGGVMALVLGIKDMRTIVDKKV